MITLAASSIGTVILIVLLISLFGGGFWGYRAGWGPWPVGGLGGLLVLLIVLWALGVLGCTTTETIGKDGTTIKTNRFDSATAVTLARAAADIRAGKSDGKAVR